MSLDGFLAQSLTEVSWKGARLCTAPLEEEIPALKAGADRDLVACGGARIARSLMRHRLIDGRVAQVFTSR